MLRSAAIAASAVAAILVAACGGDKSTTPKPPTVASVTLSQSSATLEVGATLTLTATAKDGSGNALTGRTVTWTSSNSGVATVDNGIVTGVSVGTATITATIDGKRADALITVQQPAVASITITPASRTLTVGASFQLTATLTDARGNPLTGRAVTWTTSDASKVTVSQTGVVTGVAVGTAIITATSEGKSATATITVSDGTPPTIGAISPDTIGNGATVTITGTGFGANPADNTVTVAGTPVVVTAASATQLTFTLPASFPCLATQRVTVVVTTGVGSATAQKPLKVAVTRTLAVGGTLMLTDVASLGCNELAQTGGRYLMSVYNTSTAPTSTASFELKGNMAASQAPVIAASRRAGAPRALVGAPLGAAAAASLVQERERAAGAFRERARMLENDRAIVRALGTRRARTSTARRTAAGSVGPSPSGGTAGSPLLAPVPLTVGAYTSLRIRKTLNTCSTFITVRARVAYVGAKSVVLEDSLSPTAGTIDADLANIGQQFDNVMYPILVQNFGDPLAYDAQTDNNGRILMLFTPRVDSLGGGAGTLQGFVSACDLYPPTIDPQVAASNQAEIFYARVPASAAQAANFRRGIYGTVIHESKHLAANAEKFARNADVLEESWLEEGTAQIALELYARTRPQYAGVVWKSNATYLQTVYCDVRPNGPPARCAGAQFLMADPLFELHDYERANETKSFLSSASSDITIYGSAWKFVRWATDQYATVESDFLKSIVLETRLTGVANIEDKTRRRFTELDGWFTLALLADDYPGFTPPADAKYIFPSWNTPDIFAGAAADFPNRFVASPLNTHVITFGDFTVSVPALAGGSGSLFNLSGTQTGPQAIALRAPGDAPIGTTTTLRIVILRVQ